MNPPGKSFKEARYKNTSQIKVFSLYKYVPKEILDVMPSPKIAPKDQKSAKKPPSGSELKVKR